jgi:hypothetical protein
MATAVASCRLLDLTNATTTAARLAVAPSSTQTSVERDRFSSANCSVPAASRGQQMPQTQARRTAEATVQATSAANSGAVNAATAAPATSPVVRLVSTRRAERTRPAFAGGHRRVRHLPCLSADAVPRGSESCGVDVISGDLWALVIARGADEMGPVMCGREEVSSQGGTVVALLADPDAPTEIAQRMAQILPRRLTDKLGHGRRFHVEVVSEPFSSGTEDPPTLMRRIIDRASAEHWDIVVALTELPLHSREQAGCGSKSRARLSAAVSSPAGGLTAADEDPAGRGRSRPRLGHSAGHWSSRARGKAAAAGAPRQSSRAYPPGPGR